ncbi:MAG TPA: hypothetical protein VHM93_15345 [Candidatus Acidoferrum sp.]|jgi:hypothetical protein|nr:hypothetical protein [Candidatus Acidoferrum sp.]
MDIASRKALLRGAGLLALLAVCAQTAGAQGASPETAASLFPGGGLVSYNSVFTTRGVFPSSTGNMPSTARPTFSHEGLFNFTWGFHRDFALTVLVPVVTNRFDMNTLPARSSVGGTGLGDVVLLVKYRFYRRDCERGTTQASVTVGPKIPTGSTSLTGTSGLLLPAGLQPGSGSTDFFVAGNWTYTGVLNLKRLVADEDFHATLRSQGTQKTQLGSNVVSRFWLSYRPYQSKNLSHEWFIGPELTWLHMQDDRIAGIVQNGSGGDALLAGVTSYVGLRPGLHAWIGADWDVAHSSESMFMPVRRHISFGITRQFRLRF